MKKIIGFGLSCCLLFSCSEHKNSQEEKVRERISRRTLDEFFNKEENIDFLLRTAERKIYESPERAKSYLIEISKYGLMSEYSDEIFKGLKEAEKIKLVDIYFRNFFNSGISGASSSGEEFIERFKDTELYFYYFKKNQILTVDALNKLSDTQIVKGIAKVKDNLKEKVRGIIDGY